MHTHPAIFEHLQYTGHCSQGAGEILALSVAGSVLWHLLQIRQGRGLRHGLFKSC